MERNDKSVTIERQDPSNYDQAYPIERRRNIRIVSPLGNSTDEFELQSNRPDRVMWALLRYWDSILWMPAEPAEALLQIGCQVSASFIVGNLIMVFPVVFGIPFCAVLMMFVSTLSTLYRDSPQSRLMLGLRLLMTVIPIFFGAIGAIAL